MKINELISNKKALEEVYNNYIKKKLIAKSYSDLSQGHIAKSNSNMEFVSFLLDDNRFLDWAIVGLYYGVYHASLALLSKKGFSSKDHNATLCFLIKNFAELSEADIELIDQLAINREDIEFYAGLKQERQKASYSTSLLFSKSSVEDLRKKSLKLINKIQVILG